MMLAAALCAEGHGKPPPELRLAWQAERWHALPCQGALRDQPAGLLDRMAAVKAVFDAFVSWQEREPGEEGLWVKRNPRAWAIIQGIERMRRRGGNA